LFAKTYQMQLLVWRGL